MPSGWNRAGVKAEISGTILDVELVRGISPCMTLDGVSVDRVPLDGGEYKVLVEFV